MPAPTPSAAPPSAPRISPNRTSSAIFIVVFSRIDAPKPPDWSHDGAGRFNAAECGDGQFDRREVRDSGAHGAFDARGEGLGQILAEQLLNQIERIEERTEFGDAPIAQGVELRDVELHNAPVVAFFHQ